MANVGLQNFIKGFASAAAGYQRGKILSRQFQMEQEQQQFERDLRQKQIQQQFLQADRSYRLQQDQFNYLKERDTTQDANTLRKETAAEKLRRELAEQASRDKDAELFEKHYPDADYRLIKEKREGKLDPSIATPPIPMMIPGGLGGHIPAATGNQARELLKGSTASQIRQKHERDLLEERRRAAIDIADERENARIARQQADQEKREAREKEFAEGQLRKYQEEITQAKKMAVDLDDPSILVKAYQEHDSFARRYPQYGFREEGKKYGYYFGDPRKTTGTRTSQVSVVPFPGASPQGPWSGVETGNLVTPKEGLELQEEINARNLEVAGKELKLEKAAALKSIEGMRKVFTSRAFERLPEQDQMRFFERWADEHIKAGLTPPIPKGSGYENIHPELLYRMEQMAKQKDLDRNMRVAEMKSREKIAEMRDKVNGAFAKAGATGNSLEIRTALSVVTRMIESADKNLRALTRSEKPDATAVTQLKNEIADWKAKQTELTERLVGSPGKQTNSAVTKDPKAKSFNLNGKTFTFTYQELLDQVKDKKRANEIWHNR